MSPAKFRWGLILIQIGIIILLFNMDIIGEGAIEDLLVLFPVVLIAIGVEKIFTKTKLSFIAYLAPLFLFFGGFFIVLTSSGNSYYDDFFSESSFSLDTEPDIERIDATLKLDEADLKIRDAGRDLVYARFDKFTRKPKITHETIGGVSNIEFSSRSGSFLGGAVKVTNDEPQDWYIRFSDELPLDLTCDGNESYIHLNLSTTLLENLNIDADNSDIYVKLGDLVSKVAVRISGTDSNLKLRLPETAGVRISGEELSNYLDALGFVESDDGSFVNEGYDIYDVRINVEIDNRIDNLQIDMY